jgi:gluconokinase
MDGTVVDRGAVNRTVVVMGVTGSGKTTVGQLLAERLGVSYAEADSFHPPANIVKMAAGQALDDDDRYPWLAAVAGWIAARGANGAGTGGVVSCSALKARYRDMLRAADPNVWFLHLAVDPDVIAERVAGRIGHFMPVSLVASQFEALEALRADEAGMVVDGCLAPDMVVRLVLRHLTAGDRAVG